MMRYILGLILFVFVIGIGVFGFKILKQDDQREVVVHTGTVMVVLHDSGYEPSELTVKKGTHVIFTSTTGRPHWPASNLHPTHDIFPEFDPLRPLAPDEEWGFTFERVGKFNFHDHLRAYYVGTIQVIN